MATKNSIFEEHLKEWLQAKGSKKKRGEMVRHISFATGVHPKSVPRSFKRLQMRDAGIGERRGRSTYYTADVTAALKDLWIAASEPCGENLHPLITEYVQILKRDGQWLHNDAVTGKLLEMSLGLMKKRVVKFSRKRFLVHGKSTTQAGTIHSLIPVRTGPWSQAPTGTLQIDTVAHCGGSVAGDYVFTVNSTDVSTLWGTRRAQWNKGQEVTVRSMESMANDTPFSIHEWHPDSGSEFINWHCKGWCEKRGEQITRSRPNHKNDNCFVEERNGHVVRRWVGYTRLDTREVVEALNAVYDMLTPYLNHFVASKRTVSKERMGSKWIIKRESVAKTPYQRVLLRDDVSDETKRRLQDEHARLNPLLLKQEIDQRLKKVFDIQRQHTKPPTLEERFR